MIWKCARKYFESVGGYLLMGVFQDLQMVMANEQPWELTWDKWSGFKVGGPPIVDAVGMPAFSGQATSECMHSCLPVGYVGVINTLTLGPGLLLISCVVWGKSLNQSESPCLQHVDKNSTYPMGCPLPHPSELTNQINHNPWLWQSPPVICVWSGRLLSYVMSYLP